MDEFDRDRQSRESGRYGERDPRRRPTDEDVPVQRPARSSSTDPQRQQTGTRPEDFSSSRRPRPATSEPIPRSSERASSETGERYSDRFRRSQERYRDEVDEAPVSSRDPY